MPKYLFTCPSCDKPNEISPTQAGEDLHCRHCSLAMNIPSLSEIRSLQQVDDGKEVKAGPWSMEQGLTFAIGATVAFFSLIVIVISLFYRSQLDTKDTTQDHIAAVTVKIDQFEPAIAYEWWKVLKTKGIGEPQKPAFVIAREDSTRLLNQIMIAAAVGALGLVISASAFFIGSGQRA